MCELLILNFPPPAASSKGQHEITIPAGLPQYCFDGLSPDALYNATVFVQTPNLEGPGVGVKERTRKCFSEAERKLSHWEILVNPVFKKCL